MRPHPQSTPVLKAWAIVGIIVFLVINFLSSYLSGRPPSEQQPAMIPAVDKSKAIELAYEFVRSKEQAGALRAEVGYNTDKLFNGYLQKEGLADAYTRIYGEKYPTEYWRVEVSDAQAASPEESSFRYAVDLDMMSGSVIGFEKQSGAEAPEKQAGEAAALNYLAGHGVDMSGLDLDRSSQGSYTFRDIGRRIGEAVLEHQVTVRGSEITAYHRAFQPPAAHKDWQTMQDAFAGLMTLFSLTLSLVMTIAAIVLTARGSRGVSFQRGIIFTAFFALMYTVNTLNTIPVYKITDGPFQPHEALVFNILFSLAITALLSAQLYFSLLGGDMLWRRAGTNMWPRWHEDGFAGYIVKSMTTGYLVCFIVLGAQNLLLFIGEQRFHVWGINDAAMSMQNMLVPALFPLMAWVAGISEEAVYRLFGIMLFKKLLRFNFLAVLVPSMIWALSHTTYPIYPWYTRFVEVTVLGLLFGYAMLKFGFWTAVFAHTAMDCILMGLSLMLMSGTVSMVLIGLLYMVSPVLFALAMAMIRRRFPPRRPPGQPGQPERVPAPVIPFPVKPQS
ncbi:CPBP family intramembrane glutamic endopeptidase [Paenibacillus sp. y28]|uniref:CPBP family intramembrane glutamic endopeptidase n=1 Tax=Paenibacillus sp. y28 TaxID=3129110 RepID=UPI003017476D